ncbi:hypothetical protein PHYSODRAFT_286696 [Phytophthora sojae]|uniref:RxLR effector protein n=1 Tax=Phytophthora sojae (strain P6497) TaxID=1094619 RepID=G4ZRD4_PHYSP|nr:hypothetical protein PHYSODRAFT_286696 [Phytophthora sojae]EGZ13819.1 hypothetical protein PHYSODRAFT_286696 [Phytophthora sojae]|eukprot:XP_009531248.1 hypothetical protein PHYSODRAFT_286696 [Phytophthora sojae]
MRLSFASLLAIAATLLVSGSALPTLSKVESPGLLQSAVASNEKISLRVHHRATEGDEERSIGK